MITRALVLLMLIVLGSCHKTDPTADWTYGGIPNGIHANIDGVTFSFSAANFSNGVLSKETDNGKDNIELLGLDVASDKQIDLVIKHFKTTGTYYFTQGVDSATLIIPNKSGSYYLGPDFHYVATDGSITIVAANDHFVAGTFSFSAHNIQVTDGTFNISYQ